MSRSRSRCPPPQAPASPAPRLSLDPRRLMGNADRLGFRRAALAQVDREDREGAHRKKLRLPVLKRRLPERSAAQVTGPGARRLGVFSLGVFVVGPAGD